MMAIRGTGKKEVSDYSMEALTNGLKPYHRDEFKRLYKVLKKCSAFQLVILQFNDPLYRDGLITMINQLEKRTTILRLNFSEFPTFHSFEEKIKDLSKENRVIHLVNLENWLFPENSKGMILGFNYHRESIAENCRAALLLWMTEPNIKAFAIDAPDMWAWRSAVLRFDIEKPKESFEPIKRAEFIEGLSLKGRLDRINEILEFMKNPPVDLTDKLNISLLNELGQLYSSMGKYDEATKHLEKCLKIAETSEDKKGIATAIHQLGIIHYAQGDYDKAIDKYNQSLKIFDELGYKGGIAATLHQLGMIHYLQGDYDKAIDKYNQSLKIFERLGDKRGIATTLHQFGIIHQDQGDYDKAIDKYNQSLKIEEKLGNNGGIARNLLQWGVIHQDQGDYDKAMEKYTWSLKIFEELGDRGGIATILYQWGVIHQDQGDYDKAVEKYNQSLKIFEELGYKEGIARALSQLGRIFEAKEDYKEALRNHRICLSIFESLRSPYREIAIDDINRIKTKIGEGTFDSYYKQIMKELEGK